MCSSIRVYTVPVTCSTTTYELRLGSKVHLHSYLKNYDDVFRFVQYEYNVVLAQRLGRLFLTSCLYWISRQARGVAF